MAQTANGWPVIPDNDTTGKFPRLRKWVIPGTGRYLLMRDGALGFILAHVALWFHESIERLNAPGSQWDEWGWAVRPIRGQSTGYSNHAGGAAEDLNSTKHPRGKSPLHNYTKKQIRSINLRMKLYRGIVIWGGNYKHVKDGMHFEIARVTHHRCVLLARMLAKTPRGRRLLKSNPGAAAVLKAGH
jgi:hypothetical protein